MAEKRKADQDLGSSRRVTSRLGKALLAGVAAIFIFSLGGGVGDGRMSLGFNPNPSSQLPGHLNYASVDEVYDQLRQNYDGTLDEKKLLAGLKDGLTEATEDPYTTYFTPDEAQKFDEQMNNSFSGIGAELG